MGRTLGKTWKTIARQYGSKWGNSCVKNLLSYYDKISLSYYDRVADTMPERDGWVDSIYLFSAGVGDQRTPR